MRNIASAWLLSGGHDHGHGHGHSHSHHDDDHEEEAQRVTLAGRPLLLSIYENCVPPRFRLASEDAATIAGEVTIETVRSGNVRQQFLMVPDAGYLECPDTIPLLHAKRLERGRFTWPTAASGVAMLTPAQAVDAARGVDWRAPKWSAAPEFTWR